LNEANTRTPSETFSSNDNSRAPGGELLQLVGFRLEGEEYCLKILDVQEIIRMQSLTRVPNAPDFIEGVINLRGKVIPVIGLRMRFGLQPHHQTKDSRIVVVELNSEVVGFEVDSVSEVLRIPAATVEPAPRLSMRQNEYISGVAKLGNRLLLLLDLGTLMADAEKPSINALTPPAPGAEVKEPVVR
jgi:purine-binding chemotaxis protein CheW